MLNWRSFIGTFCYVSVGFAGALYLFILLVDPYDNVPFSLPLEREPISTNQRFAYPSLARNPSFDSAIIGTSTARLLKPERLNKLTGDSWVNLAMNSATAYEQMEMLKLFLRHHPDAKHIVVGIDDAWCNPGKDIQKFTFRPFPPWMYDDNRWNDLLYLFNDKAFENAVRTIEYWVGYREAKYNSKGYRNFEIDFGTYDPKVAKGKLYRNSEKRVKFEDSLMRPTSSGEMTFGAHQLLVPLLKSMSADNSLVFIFMPFHANYLSNGKEKYQNCKSSILAFKGITPEIESIDLMQINATTAEDLNYWDPLHFREHVAFLVESRLDQTLRRRKTASPELAR